MDWMIRIFFWSWLQRYLAREWILKCRSETHRFALSGEKIVSGRFERTRKCPEDFQNESLQGKMKRADDCDSITC